MRGKESGEAKVYAFVTFKTKEMASKAIDKLNKSTFKGNEIKCSASKEKHRLFIGNIAGQWLEEDLRKAVTEFGPGVNSVELLEEPKNSDRNCGFAFIEYYSHACAEYSRQKMSNPKFKLDNNAPTVKWAEPEKAGSSAASQVKAVYVKNLPENISRITLRSCLSIMERSPKWYSLLLKLDMKIADLVMFTLLRGHLPGRRWRILGNMKLTVHLSIYTLVFSNNTVDKYIAIFGIDRPSFGLFTCKPQSDQKSSRRTPVSKNSILLPTYPPELGYGLVGGAYGALGSRYGVAGLTQPLVYGRGAAPAGTAMMPMLLPDGRIGYVLQQSGVQQHSSSPPSRGGSSRGGRRSDDKNRSRYHPY